MTTLKSDPAAIFACALSLWNACRKRASNSNFDLSESFNGMDQLMREVMAIADLFERWASQHIEFDALEDIWPYLLQDQFGEAYLSLFHPKALPNFDESDCLAVAIRLRLPVIVDGSLPIPVNLTIQNPIAQSPFRKLRIQTVRALIGEDVVTPFVPDDDPFDESFSSPIFALYGVDDRGLVEHIADRNTYDDIVCLLRKLVPGITVPDRLTFCHQQ